jgi:hypothetical protein
MGEFGSGGQHVTRSGRSSKSKTVWKPSLSQTREKQRLYRPDSRPMLATGAWKKPAAGNPAKEPAWSHAWTIRAGD